MIEGIVYGVLIVGAFIGIAVERRIMRKPEAERSDRERRFMVADRKVAAGFNQFGRNVAPLIVIIASGVLLLLSLLFWFQQEQGAATLTTVIGVIGVAAGLWLRRYVSKQRGSDWQANQDSANRSADAEGRPRWFGNPRAGIGLGLFFAVAGGALLVIALIAGQREDPFQWVIPAGLVIFGSVCVIGAMAQLRHER